MKSQSHRCDVRFFIARCNQSCYHCSCSNCTHLSGRSVIVAPTMHSFLLSHTRSSPRGSPCITFSHDPSVNAQFIGSCLPHMCLPFNASAVPRSDLYGCDESIFPYALAFHTLMPLFFPLAFCVCGELAKGLGETLCLLQAPLIP
jgi:hypothetical protein